MKTPTTPCLRCRKTEYIIAKTLEKGTVCGSCITYFQTYESCSECGNDIYQTSHRTLPDGTKRLLCNKCYSKHLPVCSSCGYRRKALSFTLQKKPLCRFCTVEVTRKCTKCSQEFPAGQGRVCQTCHYNRTLDKKVAFIAGSFTHLNECFVDFSKWLLNRRGLLFTATHIQNYQLYFYQIEKLYEQLQQMPSYEVLLNRFRFATGKKYLLVHLYLDEVKLITIEKSTTDKYANFNLIEKQLSIFEEGTMQYKIIQEYYSYMCAKLGNKQLQLRSIRLALTPAIKFLQYCQNFKDSTPSMYILEGYLWLYAGQRATITEFIDFLVKQYSYELQITKVPKATLMRPNVSHQILKGRVIQLMQNPKIIHKKLQYFYAAIFGYFHWVNIPQNVFMGHENLHRDKYKNYYVQMSGKKFYLPEQVTIFILRNSLTKHLSEQSLYSCKNNFN